MTSPNTHPTCEIKLHTAVSVGTKGQVVIPQEVREMLNIKPGDSLMVITKGNKAIGMIKTDDMPIFMEYMHSEMHSTL